VTKGSLSFSTERCKACELCICFCPQGILALDTDIINVHGFHPVSVSEPEKCTGCGICALMCPDLVITVKRE